MPMPEEPSSSGQSDELDLDVGVTQDILRRHGHWVSLAVAVGCAVFVLLQLRPDLLISDTTPSGGDMGAHVWGPAYMRDHLLSQGRLTGWTPDWYAGFPAYVYYMIAPPLAIITVNAGFNWLIGLPLAAAILAGTWFASRTPKVQSSGFVGLVRALGIILALAMVFVPYGAAFKLVSVSGLVLMPIAGWAMAKLSGAVEPIPALTAIGVTVFLFDTNFNIYGGNIASTLAGEFAFSISLAIALLTIGWLFRALDTGRWRASAAVLLAMVALTHVIPLIFVMFASMLLIVFTPSAPRWWILATGLAAVLIPIGLNESASGGRQIAAIATFPIVVLALGSLSPELFGRIRQMAIMGPVGALISAIWLFPFYMRSDYFNDMGWERLDDYLPDLFNTPMQIALPVAAVGALLSFAFRDRLGMLFSVLAVVCALGVANLPDGKLWNARILPFYYLSVYLVAAIGIALLARVIGTAVSERFKSPDPVVTYSLTGVALAGALLGVSFSLQSFPGAFEGVNDNGEYTAFGIAGGEKSFIPSWVNWNYSGYEEKRSYLEYSTVVDTMAAIGQENGCGRAMWEYSSDLDRYGTPMALMLLPHWTDGCIGSMEGLYFESSASTPFHFLNQSTLSVGPSRAQRDLPYQNFNIDRGIAQLQTVGVRYYMAQSDEAIAAAANHPGLVEVGESQPFVIYEVVGTELVESLIFEPVVATGPTEDNITEASTRFDIGWESQAVTFYNDPDAYQALPAENGPSEWEEVSTLATFDGTPIDAAGVSDIRIGRSSINFRVDQVGSPVLVKMSYFPNWKVSGAEGPYRAGPNLMVVIPTENDVELTYGTTMVDYLAYLLFLVGVGGAAYLAWDGARKPVVIGAAGSSDDDDGERLEKDLFAQLLAESETQTEPENFNQPDMRRSDPPPELPSAEVGLADRMLEALDPGPDLE